LDRALGGQLIKSGYLLKITTESIENNRIQPMESANEGAIHIVLGNLLIFVWKRNQYEQSLYMSRKD
jgi:hypothetical protein